MKKNRYKLFHYGKLELISNNILPILKYLENKQLKSIKEWQNKKYIIYYFDDKYEIVIKK